MSLATAASQFTYRIRQFPRPQCRSLFSASHRHHHHHLPLAPSLSHRSAHLVSRGPALPTHHPPPPPPVDSHTSGRGQSRTNSNPSARLAAYSHLVADLNLRRTGKPFPSRLYRPPPHLLASNHATAHTPIGPSRLRKTRPVQRRPAALRGSCTRRIALLGGTPAISEPRKPCARVCQRYRIVTRPSHSAARSAWCPLAGLTTTPAPSVHCSDTDRIFFQAGWSMTDLLSPVVS